MFLSAAALIAISVLGGINGWDELPSDGTPLQRSVAIGSLIYAFLGIVAGVGVLLRKSWSFPMAILWAIATTYTGTVASVAWAERGQPIKASLIIAFIGCVVICGLVAWGAYVATRRDNMIP
jgi:hypothetical protein